MNKIYILLFVGLLVVGVVSATNVECGWGNALCKEDDVQDAVDDLDEDISNLQDGLDDVEHVNYHQDRDISSLERENDRQDIAIGFNYLIDYHQSKKINTIEDNDAIYREDRVGGGVSSSFVYRALYGVNEWFGVPLMQYIEENYMPKTSFYKLETRVAMIQEWAQENGYVEGDLDKMCAARWGNCDSEVSYIFVE